MADPRAQSLLRLIEFIKAKSPSIVLLENVEGFRSSKMHDHYVSSLKSVGYAMSEIKLCSSMFGVPMLRPRVFVIAIKGKQTDAPPVAPSEYKLPHCSVLSLRSFFALENNLRLKQSADADSALVVPAEQVEKFAAVLNIINENEDDVDRKLICFTSGYFRCRKASGTLLRLKNGVVRFFSPAEILSLLGFSPDFNLETKDMGAQPLSQAICYRLVGNSVDVRAIAFLLDNVLTRSEAQAAR